MMKTLSLLLAACIPVEGDSARLLHARTGSRKQNLETDFRECYILIHNSLTTVSLPAFCSLKQVYYSVRRCIPGISGYIRCHEITYPPVLSGPAG